MTSTPTAPAVNVFVAPDGNAFMADIAAWLVDAATTCGRTARLVTDRLPEPDGSVNLVVAPHEFYVLRNDTDAEVRAAARCSIPICTEQPGTPWFRLTVGLCEGSPLVVDINEVGADALRHEGFDVHRLRLGATPSMIHPSGADARDVDVLFLGGSTPRRARVLAGLAPVLWDRSSEIRTFRFTRPVTGDEPGLVFGDEKYELLARSTMLVNIHRGGDDGADDEVEYFEWARMVEAMANGCLVVTEPSTGHEPLVADEHFVECAEDDLADTVVALLDDTERRTRIIDAARTAVTGPLALERTVAELLVVADPIAQRLVGRVATDGTERVAGRGANDDTERVAGRGANDGVEPGGVERGDVDVGAASAGRRDGRRSLWFGDRLGRSGVSWRRSRRSARPVVRTAPPPLLPVFAPYRSLRRDVYDQLLAEIAHRRDLGRFRSLLDHGDPDHVSRTTTPAWDGDTDDAPEDADAGRGDVATIADVSVVVTVFDYADVVEETLDSIIASHDVAVEIVIVDDASHDDSVAVVQAWMDHHPDVPVVLLARAANQGLTRARNLAIGHARADLVMIMDADNLVYPTCLSRLADALSDDPTAAFAYSTLEAFGADPGLRSAQGWHVPWLCDANYIDAQAMIRRSTLDRFDGYRVDDTMYGWEDWDLWLRIADAGEHGVHVPQMLGRYRTQPGSMVSLTNLAAADLRADLVARYLALPWPPSDTVGA